jgi:hypothetical protein
MSRWGRGLAALALCAMLPACGGSSQAQTQPATTAASAGRFARTVWLCRPGLPSDPCRSNLTATLVRADGSTRIESVAPARNPAVDCFYVYPTVSLQQRTNADLTIGPEQRTVALLQASRFSQACRVFAPVYRQLTLSAILRPGGITATAALTAYRSLLAGFRDYLAHDNRGRGIVFIGHSQGASMLITLLRQEVDPNPALRRRLVSAVLLGGNVLVAAGGDVGGDFQHIPACRSIRQIGCVVAYSSFDRTPPTDSYFGRAGTGLNPFVPRGATKLSVLCVNPAAPGGGAGRLDPYFPVSSLGLMGLRGASGTPKTPWVAYPGEYRARCMSSGSASWLQIDPVSSSDPRPRVTESSGPRWGLHVDDVNLALGNLVYLVREQASAYTHSRLPPVLGSASRSPATSLRAARSASIRSLFAPRDRLSGRSHSKTVSPRVRRKRVSEAP